jgi:hypothetical protein
MTTPMNYTQQQHAYLQAWRQVLEPLMPMPQAMLHPGGAWPMPAMPPYPQPAPPAPPGMPATPPMAPDYAQQLFSYLQAWRQHLETMLGTPPLPAQPSGSQPYDTAPPADAPPSTPASSGGYGYGRPNVPLPPENPGAGRRSGLTGLYYGNSGGDSGGDSGGNSGAEEPPKFNAVRALNETGSQQPGDGLASAENPQRVLVKPKFPGLSAHVPDFGRPDVRARGTRVIAPPGLQPNRQYREPSPRVSGAVMPAKPPTLFRGLAERASLRDSG